MNGLYAFFSGTEWYVYVVIFLAKILEISVSTLRIILVNKGYRAIAFITGLVEIFLWLFVASAVLTDLNADPLKALPYGIGFSVGVVLGSIIEEWLAFGYVVLQIICDIEKAGEISEHIRSKHIGVTEVAAKGYKGERKMLTLFINRKGANDLVGELEKIDGKAMFIINDVTSIQGGTVPKRQFFLHRMNRFSSVIKQQ